MFPSACLSLLTLLILVSPAFSQGKMIRYDFSGPNPEENSIGLWGPGFDSYPLADVSFGPIPTDNAFDDATDGQGITVQADPGEGVMIMTNPLQAKGCALARCSVRTSEPDVTVYIATFDTSDDSFVSTRTTYNKQFFTGRYNRIADVFLHPSVGLIVVIQVLNDSTDKPATIYIDNLDILPFAAGKIELNWSEVVAGPIRPSTTTPTPIIPTSTPTQAPPTPTPLPTTPTPALPTPTSPMSGTIETVTVPLPNLSAEAKALEMVLIKVGTFTMGSPIDQRGRYMWDWLPHSVTLTRNFYLGKYEVTQAQYQEIMMKNPSKFANKPNHPVDQVSWYDCALFCNQLSRNMGYTPVYDENNWSIHWEADGFRLPTEAEWEYACKAGTTTRYSFGDALECTDADDSYCAIMDQYMWWGGNDTYNGNASGTKEAGLKLPNPWGLFDMHGNVTEWCSDRFENPYQRGAQMDPHGAISGDSRNLRGGGYGAYAYGCLSSGRYWFPPEVPFSTFGFRLARTHSVNPSFPTATPAATPTPIQELSPTPATVTPIETIAISLPDLSAGAKPLEMVLIRAGSFNMGSPAGERNREANETQHPVTLTHDFYLGKYEVTQEQWEAVMGSNPSIFQGENLPVDTATWSECQIFIRKLNELGQGTFRLPTEAEWEYACRAGTTSRFSFGDALECSDSGDNCTVMDQYMWWIGNDPSMGMEPSTKAVGLKLPNPWGLFDMHGNVWEWCSDWFEAYPNTMQIDPKGPGSGFFRVARGGGFYYGGGLTPAVGRSAYRGSADPTDWYFDIGLRLAKDQ